MTALFGMLIGLLPDVGQGVSEESLSPLLVLRPGGAAFAQTTGCEDWERGVLRAEGRAAAPDWARNPAQAQILAIEGARTMAYRQLAECIGGVRVAGGTKVQKAMTEDQEAAMAVQGVIKGARMVREDLVTVAGALMGVVTLELPLHGEQSLGGQLPPRWRPLAPESPPSPQAPSAPPSPRPTPTIDSLIVDARGLSAYPGLYPQVLTEGDRVVYESYSVDREHRELIGRVTNSVEKAKTLLREQGATNPLVVKVARMQGPTNYIIAAEDAKQVISADLTAQFLRKSRVVFVLGL